MVAPMEPGQTDGSIGDEARLDASALVTALDSALYRWTIESDQLDWFPAPPQGLAASGSLLSGAEWDERTDSDAITDRRNSVLRIAGADDGNGIPYELEYPLRVRDRNGTRLVWIEDIGRCYAGADGRPLYAHGIVRIVAGRGSGTSGASSSSRIDPLTGTLSRPRLLDTLGVMITDARRFQTSCGFLLLAVENVGLLDHSYGRAADELIGAVGRRLRASMRAGDAIGRFSTTIFGLALANCTSADLLVAARRFMDAIHDEPVQTGAGPIGVRVTGAGIVAPRHAADQAEMVGRAVDTLVALRRRRRGRFEVYAPSPARDAQRRQDMRLAEELIAALNDDRLILSFQPVVDARSLQPVWYEALARLRKVDGEAISVSRHVEAAEKLGLIHLLDRRVLELTISALVAAPSAEIAINISAETMSDHEWREHLLAAFRRHPETARRLLVEITETAAPGDLAEALDFVSALREAGVRVALDDFGAGQTSFRALRALGVDLVKIDGEFIRGMRSNSGDRAFIRAIVSLAREIGFRTVAESVEDPEIAEILREIGTDFLQGDLYGAAGSLPKI
ncbi:EAL domain-containing protein [Terrihabitans sp. B22-R8]|uniref:EAL domain-containing protein n=1 Tax=Terrihabitans sp. B22-R8 TaxID=3425128 RepID=UPI00403C3374